MSEEEQPTIAAPDGSTRRARLGLEELLAVGVLVVVALRIAGWVVSIAGLSDEDLAGASRSWFIGSIGRLNGETVGLLMVAAVLTAWGSSRRWLRRCVMATGVFFLVTALVVAADTAARVGGTEGWSSVLIESAPQAVVGGLTVLLLRAVDPGASRPPLWDRLVDGARTARVDDADRGWTDRG